MILDTVARRRELLARVRKVAVVGASASPLRASYFVFTYLRTHGFDVRPINPAYARIDGIPCYPTLAAYVKEFGAPDVVDVFRNPADLVDVTRDVISVGAPAIWYQYGVVNQDAVRLADAAGLDVVVDRCMKVEHARFSGGLSISGMNSGLITSRRRM